MRNNRKNLLILGFSIVAIGTLLPNVQGQPRGFRRGGFGMNDAPLEKSPAPKDDNEKKVLAVLDNILATESYLNVPPADGRLLRILAESMQAKHIVELGTSTGYSTIWMGLGLQKTSGKMTTYEIDAGRAATARKNFKLAGMEDIITLVEGNAHEKIGSLTDPIDIIFLDADKEGYMDYLNKLLPLLRPGGLVIAHNITPGMADPAFMEAITTNPNLETVVRGGISLTLKKN